MKYQEYNTNLFSWWFVITFENSVFDFLINSNINILNIFQKQVLAKSRSMFVGNQLISINLLIIPKKNYWLLLLIFIRFYHILNFLGWPFYGMMKSISNNDGYISFFDSIIMSFQYTYLFSKLFIECWCLGRFIIFNFFQSICFFIFRKTSLEGKDKKWTKKYNWNKNNKLLLLNYYFFKTIRKLQTIIKNLLFYVLFIIY